MNTSLQTQAVLLLTAWFTKPAKDDPKPLTPAEWGRFAAWLRAKGKTPESLMSGDPVECLQGWLDPTITQKRIHLLMARSAALGLALEKWQRAGLWVMTRSDADYPTRFKKRLKLEAPPVLFGCGDRGLLDRGGIAVVGSRNAREDDLRYTSNLGAGIAKDGLSVVSGGAQGVDETSMLGALEADGTVIGILADSLLRAATSAKYRKGLLSKNLVLASPFNPEAGFNVGNAMARNKYIYCLADAAIVVTTSKESGGTWNGAIENLKYGWVSLWIRENPDPGSGNAALVERGARWLPATGTPKAGDLLNSSRNVPEQTLEQPVPSSQTNDKPDPLPATSDQLSFYDLFIQRLETLTSRGPVSPEDVLQNVDVNKTQVNDWLKRAEAEGRVSKLKKPVRYASMRSTQHRLNI